MNGHFRSLGLIAGRILVASLFILAAINKVANYGVYEAMMTQAGMPFVAILLPLTIVLEGVGGLMVAMNTRRAAYAGVALAVFTIVTNLVFHRFWEMDGRLAQLELSLFFKNVSVAGALLFIAAWSAGKEKT
jgi:putative oxidoreductase